MHILHFLVTFANWVVVGAICKMGISPPQTSLPLYKKPKAALSLTLELESERRAGVEEQEEEEEEPYWGNLYLFF